MVEYKNGSGLASVGATAMVSAVALIAGTTATFAQGLDGFYAGASVGLLNGDGMVADDGDDPDDYSFDNATTSGVFIGYQRDLSNGMFAGFEVAMHFGGEMDAEAADDDDPDGQYTVARILDYKFRLGSNIEASPLGPIAIYGFAGVTNGAASRYYAWDYDFSGYNVGGGIERKFDNGLSVGLEVLGRSLEVYSADERRSSSSSTQISLRSSFQF